MYHHQLDLLRTTRNNILSRVADCSLAQLNHIPDGFNNNLAWNLGHVLVTQQLLMYRLSGLATYVSDELIDAYRKGTRPTEFIDQPTIDFIKDKLLETIDLATQDFENHRFQTYKTYPTSYGVTLNSVEEATTFNNMHEAMHLGFMIALKKHL